MESMLVEVYLQKFVFCICFVTLVPFLVFLKFV